MTYQSEVTADSPEFYYRLNESSGTTASDTSGNGNDGTYTASGVTYGVSGAVTGDDAVTLSGSGEVDSGVDLVVGSSAFTVEIWVKTTNSGTMVAIGHFNGSGNNWWLGINGSNVAQFSINGDTGGAQNRIGSTTINDGAWHHLVAVRDGASLYLYVDATLEGTDPATTVGTVNPGDNVIVGDFGSSGGFHWDGSVDEAAVYLSALSSTRVTAHYDAATAGGSSVSRGLTLLGCG